MTLTDHTDKMTGHSDAKEISKYVRMTNCDLGNLKTKYLSQAKSTYVNHGQ